MKILLDLDEVLADFVGGACELFGATRPKVEQNWPIGQWDIVPPLGKTLGKPLSDLTFWNAVSDSPRFWHRLPELSWASRLVRALEGIEGISGIEIVTTPQPCPNCYSGKFSWIEKRFPNYVKKLTLTKDKPMLAAPDRILIDDKEETVNMFREKGGKGIIFPSYHNGRHAVRANAPEIVYGEVVSMVIQSRKGA